MKLLKLHFYYSFSNKTIVLLSASSILIIFSFIFAIDKVYLLPLQQAIINYCTESKYLFKLVYYFIVIYIYTESFSFANINNYYLCNNISRSKYYYTKIIMLVSVLIIYTLILLMGFILIGYIFIKNFYMNKMLLDIFLKSFCVSIFYGMIGICLNMLIKNRYIVILVFIISVFSIVIETESYYKIIPNGCWNLMYLLGINVFFVITNYLIFKMIDLNE